VVVRRRSVVALWRDRHGFGRIDDVVRCLQARTKVRKDQMGWREQAVELSGSGIRGGLSLREGAVSTVILAFASGNASPWSVER
jgi:hypothetical protein